MVSDSINRKLPRKARCECLRECVVSDPRCFEAIGLGYVPSGAIQSEHCEVCEGSAQTVTRYVKQVVGVVAPHRVLCAAYVMDRSHHFALHLLPYLIETAVNPASFAICERGGLDLPGIEICDEVLNVVGTAEDHQAAMLVLELANDHTSGVLGPRVNYSDLARDQRRGRVDAGLAGPIQHSGSVPAVCCRREGGKVFGYAGVII